MPKRISFCIGKWSCRGDGLSRVNFRSEPPSVSESAWMWKCAKAVEAKGVAEAVTVQETREVRPHPERTGWVFAGLAELPLICEGRGKLGTSAFYLISFSCDFCSLKKNCWITNYVGTRAEAELWSLFVRGLFVVSYGLFPEFSFPFRCRGIRAKRIHLLSRKVECDESRIANLRSTHPRIRGETSRNHFPEQSSSNTFPRPVT